MVDGAITTILSSGMDAFANLYDVVLTFPEDCKEGTLETTSISVRAQDFVHPELKQSQYPTDYKAITLSRLGAEITGERKFTLTLRLDSDYLLLKRLANWKHLWADPSGEGNIQFGGLAQDTTIDSKKYGKIEVYAYKSSTNLTSISDSVVQPVDTAVSWVFYDVVLLKMGAPQFTRASSAPVTVTAEFIFGRYTEPGTV